jgi:predicted alpha/beta superfamily hydrolase
MSQLERYADFPSRFVLPRHVDVWLPAGYAAAPERRYPVVYMHDGQNLCDPEEANFGVAWAADRALARLAAAGEAPPAILVGLWSTPRRYAEYRPAQPFDVLSAAARDRLLAPMGGDLLSDAYLRFIVEEVKPWVDAGYRTQPGRAATSIMGSSMGGLISLYALCEYPGVFGGAGCVSSHWPAVEGVILPYLRDRLPDPATHRLYFDYGTHTLDALYAPGQAAVDAVMGERGYMEGVNWLTRRFPGAAHFEKDWAERVAVPLRFLLSGA